MGHESWGAPKFWDGVHTIETAYDRLLLIPLLDHELYVRVFFRDGLEVVEEEGPGVC